MITVPTSTVSAILASVTSQFSDAGVLLIVGLAVALPLFFWVVNKIIDLFPSEKADKELMKRAERAIARSKELTRETENLEKYQRS